MRYCMLEAFGLLIFKPFRNTPLQTLLNLTYFTIFISLGFLFCFGFFFADVYKMVKLYICPTQCSFADNAWSGVQQSMLL